jgi:hypothetical protein
VSQYFTILKIGGSASRDVIAKFSRWASLRDTSDRYTWSASQWPSTTRQAARRWLNALDPLYSRTPIVYWSLHYDLWSAVGTMEQYVGLNSIRIELNDGMTLWCWRLPDRGKLKRAANNVLREPKFAEDAWLASRLIQCVDAFSDLSREGAIVIARSPRQLRSASGRPWKPPEPWMYRLNE